MSKKLLANVGNAVADNYRRYYQEYEGTFITATDKSEDDTLDTSRYIEVTEIWGNTIQDENNLEDIQSIGELYVDEQGQPILDDLGREQYKVEIVSCNKNLFNGEIYNENATYITNLYVLDSTIYMTNTIYNGWIGFKITGLNPSKTYTVSYIVNSNTVGNRIRYTDSAGQTVQFRKPNNSKVYVTISDTSTISLQLNLSVAGTSTIESFQIEEGDVPTDYTPYKSHKTTILLPCQLQKVGDVYDRLYWDSEKGRYVVEKKIQDVNFSNFTLKSKLYNELTTHCRILIELPYLNMNDKLVICNRLNSKVTWNEEIDNVYASNPSLGMLFMISKDKLNEISSNGCIEWIKLNNIISYYMLQTPKLIETNITEKILLPCYEEKTHIFVNSTVDATMKVLVPYKEII